MKDRAGKKNLFTLVPALVMTAATGESLIYYLVVKYIPTGNLLLPAPAIVLLGLAVAVLSLSLKKRF